MISSSQDQGVWAALSLSILRWGGEMVGPGLGQGPTLPIGILPDQAADGPARPGHSPVTVRTECPWERPPLLRKQLFQSNNSRSWQAPRPRAAGWTLPPRPGPPRTSHWQPGRQAWSRRSLHPCCAPARSGRRGVPHVGRDRSGGGQFPGAGQGASQRGRAGGLHGPAGCSLAVHPQTCWALLPKPAWSPACGSWGLSLRPENLLPVSRARGH